MIVVTGGCGFIGSNLVAGLNQQGKSNILVVDHLKNGVKFKNIASAQIADYIDKHDFLSRIQQNMFNNDISCIFHQGACSSTTEWDGEYMMRNNYEYSKILLQYCIKKHIPLVYASSAAVYGNQTLFTEEPHAEAPLNVYGYSKLLFDQQVRAHLAKDQHAPIVGLRYFNVYGPHEQHKGSMASVAYHFFHQIKQEGKLNLFAGYDGYADGEQKRDFIHVDDVVAVNLWFMQKLLDNQLKGIKAPECVGVFNVGTGKAQSFNDVAHTLIQTMNQGAVHYVPFPEHLKGCYQSFTQANISRLRSAGYDQKFLTVQQGVEKYTQHLSAQQV